MAEPLKRLDINVTGAIRLVAGKAGSSLMMAKTAAAPTGTAPAYDFATTLTPVGFGDHTPTISAATLPQSLPPPPAFDLCVTAAGALTVAYQVFGGAWNLLQVAEVGGPQPKPLYGYGLADCGDPRFVRDSSGRGTASTLATTVLDYQTLTLVAPGTPDDKGQIGVTHSVVTKAERGVAFGDLSAGAPATLAVVYKTEKKIGPLSPGNLFLGQLALAEFDMAAKRLGMPVPLLAGSSVAEFDVAYQGGVYGLLATTGDGLPLLAAFDTQGQMRGGTYLPFGSWTSRTGWVTSPTIVADPQPNGDIKFDFAFIEMDGDTPKGIVVDSIGATSTGGVAPAAQGG